MNARLQKLVALKFLEPVVVNAGRGSGIYAYGLGSAGRRLLQRLASGRGRGAPGPVWHELEVAELRVRLQEALEQRNGELVEWLGEPALRGLLLGCRGWPVPDALVHWRLGGTEGAFFVEWDRWSESLALVAAKLERYGTYWRARGHRSLLPGSGLRPRLALILRSQTRAERLVRWTQQRRPEPPAATVLIDLADVILADPLGDVWWRSDTAASGRLCE